MWIPGSSEIGPKGDPVGSKYQSEPKKGVPGSDQIFLVPTPVSIKIKYKKWFLPKIEDLINRFRQIYRILAFIL